jgi:hypothetical protein
MYKRYLLLLLAFGAAATSGESKDLVVPGDFPTLDQAIASLADGDRIVLLPGTYAAVVAPPPGVGFSLFGRGGRDSTTMKGPGPEGPCVAARGGGKEVRISGITFDRTDAPRAYAVVASSCVLTIERCRFLGGAGALADSCEGVVSRNEFSDCFDALRVQGSPLRIEGNSFLRAEQYGIAIRGSEARIYGNLFRECANTCILITGKRRSPVIGGSREHANVFVQNPWHVIANQSRNEINAQYNYWGPPLTATMEKLGYPASLDEIHDYWDQDDRAAGMVDYRNWLRSEEEAGARGRAPVWLLVLVAPLGALLWFLRARARRRLRAAS